MNSQSGFTLLSMLLALSAFLILVGLFLSVVQPLSKFVQPQRSNQKEIQTFFVQTSAEIHRSSSVSSSNDRQSLMLSRTEEQIRYAWVSPGRVIRQVNGQGYEIVLQKVSDAQFHVTDKWISIQITDQSNHQYFWSDMLYLQGAAYEQSSP
ncbi:ComGF family competence protein [Sporolactobacillus sp. CPB3-1]|uniref:ComGF family competence protein n=1 Tax=Sporolactobacillus mangiferae TaxID=2940498 RepID=A0ABT0M675_9BACL|nr:competence type IV pilus minor pilin ComGF [Sporolactobacillus mangiferae]MCL1630377.1 ComGF family competence protein [Sporolactobacillus mangiferae]